MIRVTKRETYTAIRWDGSADALHELSKTPGLRIDINHPGANKDELVVSYPNGSNLRVLPLGHWIVFDSRSTFSIYNEANFLAQHRQENPTEATTPQIDHSGSVAHLSMQ